MDVEHIAQLFIMSTQAEHVSEVTPELLALTKSPEAPLLLIQTYNHFSSNPDLQAASALYLFKSIRLQNFSEMDPGLKQQLFQSILPLINDSLSPKSVPHFSAILSLYLSENFSLYPQYLQSFPKLFTLTILSAVFDNIPSDAKSSDPSFFALAQEGLSNPDYINYSTDIYTSLLDYVNDPTPFLPCVSFVNSTIPQSSTLPDKVFSSTWFLAAYLYSHFLLPPEAFNVFTSILSSLCSPDVNQHQRAYDAIQCFSGAITPNSPFSRDPSLLQSLFNVTSEIIITYTIREGQLPDKSNELFQTSIDTLSASQPVKALSFQFLSQINSIPQNQSQIDDSIARVSFGLILLGLLIECSPDCVSDKDSVKFIGEILTTSLKTTSSDLIHIVSLGTISNIGKHSVFTELETTFLSLMKSITPYLSSPKELERQSGYSALINIITLSEKGSLPPELFSTVLQFESTVPPENQADYLKLVAILVQRIEEVDDDSLDQLINLTEQCLSHSDNSVRSSALDLAASLIQIQEALFDELIEPCGPALQSALSDPADDNFHNACDFINILATTLKDHVSSLFQPLASIIAGELHTSDDFDDDQQTRRESIALETAAILIGCCNENSLMGPYTSLAGQYFASEDPFKQRDACDSVIQMARALSPKTELRNEENIENSKRVESLFENLVSVVYSADNVAILEPALDAIRKVFKHGYGHSPDYFMEKALGLISDIIIGKIQFFEGVSPKDCPKVSQIIESLMDFVGCVFQRISGNTNVDVVNSLGRMLFEWMKNAKEFDVFPILGALIDAVEFCNTPELAGALCEYVFEISQNLTNPDIEQNIAYLMAVILKKYPQQLNLVKAMIPLLMHWFEIGKAKDSGYEELLSNIGNTFLALGAADPETPKQIVLEALKTFPPEDKADTPDESLTIIKILQSDQPKEIVLQAALGITRLLTSGKAELMKRHVDDELAEKLLILLRHLASNTDVLHQMQMALKNRLKRNALMKLLEA